MYALLYVALALLLRDRIRPFPAWLTIDGVLAGLTLAAVAAGTVFEPVRAATEGSTAVVATTLAYLVCDLLLLVMVLVSFAATAWRPGRSWWLLGCGLIVCALADSFFIFQESTGVYEAGGWLDNLWPAAFVAIALAAWQRTAMPTPSARRLVDGRGAAARLRGRDRHAPGRGAHARRHAHGRARRRGAVRRHRPRRCSCSRENFALLRSARHEALTDKLTEPAEPARALARPRGRLRIRAARTRSCSSTSTASRTTTTPSATRPATRCWVGSHPRSRPSADAPTVSAATSSACCSKARSPTVTRVVQRAVDALSARGDGFSIGASHGLVVMPRGRPRRDRGTARR